MELKVGLIILQLIDLHCEKLFAYSFIILLLTFCKRIVMLWLFEFKTKYTGGKSSRARALLY